MLGAFRALSVYLHGSIIEHVSFSFSHMFVLVCDAISCICTCDLQAITLRWTSIKPIEELFSRFIAPRRSAESKMIVAPVLILLQHASFGVVETAPKAQAKTTWWCATVDHCVDVLVPPRSTEGHPHLVLSSLCLSLGMESDSVFQNLSVCM